MKKYVIVMDMIIANPPEMYFMGWSRRKEPLYSPDAEDALVMDKDDVIVNLTLCKVYGDDYAAGFEIREVKGV